MKKNIRTQVCMNVFFGLIFTIILCANVFADTIFLKNGTKFVGKTIQEDDEKVIFKIGEGEDSVEATFFNEEVLRINRGEISDFSNLPKQIIIPPPDLPIESLHPEMEYEESQSPRAYPRKAREAELEDLTRYPSLPRDSSLQRRKTLQELMPFLNSQEADYYMKTNSLVLNKAMSIIMNPEILQDDKTKFTETINSVSQELDSAIGKIETLTPPPIFVDFHSKYLERIKLIQDILKDILSSNINNAQSKISQLENLTSDLEGELKNILSQKKKEKVEEDAGSPN